MVGALRRAGLTLALPAVVGLSTLLHWLAGRRLSGLWILPDEAIYAERALALWREHTLPILHSEGAGYGIVYPAAAGLPLSVGSLATGYASLKLLQALAMSLVAVPVFFLGRRYMRPSYALLAGVLALASPLLLYSGLVMTEVVMYPVGALSLLAIARAVETARGRDQAVALCLAALAVATRVQAVAVLPIFALASVVDCLLRRDLRRARRFWPLWAVFALVAAVAAAAPGVFGAYAGTLRGSYPLGAAAGLSFDHLSYLVLSTGIAPVTAVALLCVESVRRRLEPGAQALVVVAACAVLVVVVQVGTFAARFAPHLLGRDLAMLPPILFLVLALWLDLGAPRPRLATGCVALAIFALLALTPWPHLVRIDALPDTFGLAIFFDAGTHRVAAIVAIAAAVVLALFATLPARRLLLLPALLLGGLVASSALAARDIARNVRAEQRQLVGPSRDWIESAAAGGPVTYLYDGESYWHNVWQARFWNANLEDVVSLAPTHVPGPMPQRLVRPAPDGRLPIHTRYVVASDAHSFAGAPVARLDAVGDGLTLWRLDGAPRLTTITRGIQRNGDMTEPGFVEAYDCGGGRLDVTLIPKSTTVVTLQLDGRVVQRTPIAGLEYWNGTVVVPPSATPRTCRFAIIGQSLLGSTRIAFMHR